MVRGARPRIKRLSHDDVSSRTRRRSHRAVAPRTRAFLVDASNEIVRPIFMAVAGRHQSGSG